MGRAAAEHVKPKRDDDYRTPGERDRDTFRTLADLIALGIASTPRALWRRYTRRQMFGFIEAVAWKAHTERRYQWDLTSFILQGLGIKDPGHFPDYVSPEDGQLDPAWIEEQLDRLLGESGVLRA